MIISKKDYEKKHYPFCINCCFFDVPESEGSWSIHRELCKHPDNSKVDLVSGKQFNNGVLVEKMRETQCGIEGILFQQKE